MDHRDRMIEKFTHDPDVRVFLMSLKAGGVALNLTAASHVMLMDPWWVTLSLSNNNNNNNNNNNSNNNNNNNNNNNIQALQLIVLARYLLGVPKP